MKGVTPILQAVPPDNTRGTDAHEVAQGRDRDDGVGLRAHGRRPRASASPAATSTATGRDENFRRVVVNAILWSAKVDVPESGAKVEFDPADLNKNLDRKGKGEFKPILPPCGEEVMLPTTVSSPSKESRRQGASVRHWSRSQGRVAIVVKGQSASQWSRPQGDHRPGRSKRSCPSQRRDGEDERVELLEVPELGEVEPDRARFAEPARLDRLDQPRDPALELPRRASEVDQAPPPPAPSPRRSTGNPCPRPSRRRRSAPRAGNATPR